MIQVSNADRVVFPEVGKTKGDVVAYYARVAPRMLAHVAGRPLSIKRFPKGLAGPGFFQKNVPAHYPASIARVEIAKASSSARSSRGTEDATTTYPVLTDPDHLPYVANQGAIELHVPSAYAADLAHPDRFVLDLDPPEGAFDAVRAAACLVRDFLCELGLATAPVATGSKGFHVIGPITPVVAFDELALAGHRVSTLLAARHPAELTASFRVANRGGRVFVDWLGNRGMATIVAPYSVRARPRATVAAPVAWGEIASTNPDAFSIGDLDALVERPDPLAEVAAKPADARAFVDAVTRAFEASGLVLEPFDRFRSA